MIALTRKDWIRIVLNTVLILAAVAVVSAALLLVKF